MSHRTPTSNQSVELTATRLVSTLSVANFLFVLVTPAPGRGSSPFSR
jgi:hypothetical protein